MEQLTLDTFERDSSGQSREAKLIAALQGLADTLGKTPTSTEMDKQGEFTAKTYQLNFGSWNSALEAADLEIHKQRGTSRKVLLDHLRDLASDLGHTPTARDMDGKGEFSASTYIRRFGSWTDALQVAGVDGDREPKIPTEDLIDELHRLREDLDITPRGKDMTTAGKYSRGVYEQRFGSWCSALEEADIEPTRKRNIPADTLIEELTRLAGEIGRTPTSLEMEGCGNYSRDIYQRRFGSWNDAVEAAGLPTLRNSPGDGAEKLDYGPGWGSEKRESIRERDDRTCLNCGLPESDHESEYGMRHHVHHTVSPRQSNNPAVHNAPRNLLTLCIPCHRKLENETTLTRSNVQ